jgi:hypothetical protein
MVMVESTTDFLSDFQRNNRWISANNDNLKKQYDNQWVAVLNRAVVDYDPDLKKRVYLASIF